MKIKFTIFLLIFSGSVVLAQQSSKLTINGFIGYTLQDDITFTDSYYGYIDDCTQYGGSLEYMVRPAVTVGLSYMHMDTHIPIYDPYRNKVTSGDEDAVGLNYLMFEGTKYFGAKAILPYAGLGLGMAILNVKNGDMYTKFAWSGKFGVKIMLSQRVGVFGQAQVQSIVQGVGGGIYIGTGGVGTGITSYSSVFQFTFGGGLSFTL